MLNLTAPVLVTGSAMMSPLSRNPYKKARAFSSVKGFLMHEIRQFVYKLVLVKEIRVCMLDIGAHNGRTEEFAGILKRNSTIFSLDAAIFSSSLTAKLSLIAVMRT